MTRRLSIFAGLAAMAGLAAAGPAMACRIAPADPAALIHSTLPDPLPAGAIVARVVFEDPDNLGYEALHRDGVRARVLRMIQGHYRGATLLVRQGGMWTDCDRPARNGTIGLIVARPIGFENGLLVVQAILVRPSESFRLPDNFRLEGQ